MGSPRQFSDLVPDPLQQFRIPASTLRGEAGFSVLDQAEKAPIPGDQNEQTQERYTSWTAQTGGSLPEFLVWEWIVYQAGQVPGIDFVYQAPIFGGRTRFGGFVIDFYFPSRREAWLVQGERFHLENPADRAKNMLAAVELAGRGIKVIELWEDDLLTRIDFVMNAAYYRGEGVSTGVRTNL